jgi:hypothetical protein
MEPLAIIVTLATGIIIGWWGHILATNREAKNRMRKARDEFGGFILAQIAALKPLALESDAVREFYDRTKGGVREAVHRMWHFLPIEQRTRLDTLGSEYDQIPAHEFDRPHEREMANIKQELSKISGEEFQHPYKFQSPYEAVKHYLNEFHKFSA